MNTILRKEQVTLTAGYLTDFAEKLVINTDFVHAQTRAHYYITLADELSEANMENVQGENFQSVLSRTLDKLNNETNRTYVNVPTKPATPKLDAIEAECQAWMNNEDDIIAVDKINKIMQQFNIIEDFEKVGIPFTSGTVKLNNIYSIEQITNAIKIVQPFYGKTNTRSC